jgi:hypothetical protein
VLGPLSFFTMVVQNLELGYGDNNDRPAINRPETILGITITFLVSKSVVTTL